MLLVTAAEMRALDQATIASGHATGEALMERAGAGVVAAMEKRYGPLLAVRALVLCGTGNNGGDGFVAARHLVARGATVTVGVLGDPARAQGDAALHLERMRAAGISPAAIADAAALESLVKVRDAWDFALDAVLGTGARGAPEGLSALAVQALRDLDDAGTRVVAVDLPTGVNADTGEIARRAVRADLTVTFGAPKRGHYLYPGRAFSGVLEVVDIGLLPAVAAAEHHPFELATAEGMAALVPVRDPRAHKGSTGRVLIVGGSTGLTGAVALAARAASRTGAGYVQCAVPESLQLLLAIKLTEEMVLPMAEGEAHALAPAARDAIVERARRADAMVLGSGLSRAHGAADLVHALISDSPVPIVLDADGLNAFEGDAAHLATGRVARVLTPHLGEMARLTGTPAAEIEARRLDAAREGAITLRSVLVLKGAPTVTASPDGLATVNPTGNPGMATAGMGDVLSGVIGTFLAQGLSPYDAARLGVFVHGMAGDLAAEAIGEQGLRAGDAIGRIPRALQALARLRDAALHSRAPGGRGPRA